MSSLALAVATVAAIDVHTRRHHAFGPSKLGYIDQCSAFTGKNETTDAAEAGTFLHELMRLMLEQVVLKKFKTTREQVRGWVAQNNELSEDEIGWLQFCCDRCDVFIAKKPQQIDLEISVVVTKDDGTELNHGSIDVLFVFKNTGILLDFKFGWVPVPPADKNLQGKNYALGCLQKYPALAKIGVEFTQPKLGWTTFTVFNRGQMDNLLATLSDVIDRALYVQKNPADAQKFMKPGSYCDYCALSGSCTVLSNHRAIAAAKMNDLPMPTSFKGMELTTPADVALARYWVDIMEKGIEEIKTRAFEMAEINNGRIECVLPSGQVVAYEIRERNSDRTLGSAIEISEAFKEFVTPEEVLGAAKLSVGALETIVVNSMVEVAKAGGEKLTKKDAGAQMMSTLEALNLVSQSDKKIRFLKSIKSTDSAPETKQIENKK